MILAVGVVTLVLIAAVSAIELELLFQ